MASNIISPDAIEVGGAGEFTDAAIDALAALLVDFTLNEKEQEHDRQTGMDHSA